MTVLEKCLSSEMVVFCVLCSVTQILRWFLKHTELNKSFLGISVTHILDIYATLQHPAFQMYR